MSQSTSATPADSVLLPATDPVAQEGVFFTVAQLREAMSPVGYMTAADQINAAAAAAAQATANAAIPAATLGQPLGPVQSDATNKVPLANLPSSILGSSHYLGTWNAASNTPLLQSGTPPAGVASPIGGYYIVSVAGTTSIDGTSTWHAGDWIIWNGVTWNDISGQVNPVSSVAGLQGAVSTAQLATALAGSVGLSSSSGVLNVVLGTTANTVAAGNDSRITGAAQTPNVYTYLPNVAAIGSYTGSSPSLRTAGYYAVGDGGGAFYTQTNTGAPAIPDGAGRSWYLQDISGSEVNILQFGAKPDGNTDMQPAWTAADAFAAANNKAVFIPSPVSGSWILRTPMQATAIWTRGESVNLNAGRGTVIRWAPSAVTELATALTSNPVGGGSFLVSDLCINGSDNPPAVGNIVASGWLPARASSAHGSFSASYSGMPGNYLTVTGSTGTWAAGQSVNGGGYVAATGTATFMGEMMVVTGVTGGSFAVGQVITGSGVRTATITGQLTGTAGAAGNYTLSSSQSTISTAVPVTGTLAMANGTTITGQVAGTAGGDGTYTLSQAQPIGLGSITVTATGSNFVGSATFSGATMTVAGVTSGTVVVGQTVAGPGLTGCTVTGWQGAYPNAPGGAGTYTLSVSQPTISTAITVNGTGPLSLPAFKPGTACFAAANSGVYRNCHAAGAKYGVVFDTPYGHVFSYNCAWSGFFGVYPRINGYDYYFEGCGISGSWSGIICGSGAVPTTAGGISFRAIRTHFGFCPMAIDFLSDGGTNSVAGTWELYGCSFESFGEALFRTSPASNGLAILLDMYTSGSFNAAYQLPTSVVSNPAQFFFNLQGGLSDLRALSSNGYGNGLYAPSYPAGSAAVAYLGNINAQVVGDLDLDIFAGSVVFGSYPMSRLDARNPDYSRDFLRRREQIIRSGLLEKGNLLINPEAAANWTAGGSGTTVNVLPLSSLAGGALAGINIPQQVYRESDNPNVIVITNSSGAPNANLAAVSGTGITWNTNRSLCLHAWVFSSGTGTGSNVNLQLVTNNTHYYGAGQQQRGGFTFQEVLFQGALLSDYGATALDHCNISGNASGQIIYVIGLMASYDRPSAPNPLAAPYATNGMFLGGEHYGLSAAQAPQLIAFKTTPPAGTFPAGSIGINIASTTPVLYHYINGAWVSG